MTFIRDLKTTSVTLGNENADGSFSPVCRLELGGNNETPQRKGRLRVAFLADYPAEIEIEPGPDCEPVGNIAAQLMLWGPRSKHADGSGRQRLTWQIVVDGNGGAAGVIDSTTNDPSGGAGQSRAMPLVFNAGEARGLYVVLHPSDNTVSLQNRAEGLEWRGPLSDLIRVLRENR